METDADFLAAHARMKRWQARPIDMVREEFDAEPDRWQAEAMRLFALPTTRRLALKACKGPGKTTVLVWCILNFLATRAHCKIGATSITGDNLRDNLWAELAKWMGRSAFFTAAFTWTASRVFNKRDPNNWFCSARTWPKTGNEEEQSNALAGLHADHVMFVCDESGGYPQAVMTTAEAVLATGVECKVLQGGNPTHTTGPLYRACTIDRALWEVITVTGDPDSPVRSPRIALEWAREEIARYGRDNPWVMVNVLGEFPPASINALLGVEDVNKAMARHLADHVYNWAQKRLGVDVARFGDDRTVLFPRQGLAAFRPVVMRNARTSDIAARVHRGAIQWGSDRSGNFPLVFIDDTGHWGHGVIDQLVLTRVPCIGINYAGKATNPRYKNRRAEFWMKGAEAIQHGAALPDIPELVAELTEPTYTFLGGQFVLEEKDQIKRRLGRSPDLADAYMQTYAIEDLPSDVVTRQAERQTVSHDGDPFALATDEVDRDFEAWRK